MKPEQFVEVVVSKYQNYEGIFKNHINAEDLAPKGTKVEKALFLFYVIQLDYAIKSQKLYAGAKKLYEDDKDFFNPGRILEESEAELKKTMETYLKPRYINEAVKRYYKNSELLVKKYNSNPLLIFSSSDTCKEALGKVREFRGFGPKIGNFFVRTIINSFNYKYPDINLVLPPVDIHDVRIAYLMGYIDSLEMTPKNIQLTRELWSKACMDSRNSWLVFDKALWLLGSEGNPKTKEDIYKLLEVVKK
jgi:hypothetical protein